MLTKLLLLAAGGVVFVSGNPVNTDARHMALHEPDPYEDAVWQMEHSPVGGGQLADNPEKATGLLYHNAPIVVADPDRPRLVLYNPYRQIGSQGPYKIAKVPVRYDRTRVQEYQANGGSAYDQGRRYEYEQDHGQRQRYQNEQDHEQGQRYQYEQDHGQRQRYEYEQHHDQGYGQAQRQEYDQAHEQDLGQRQRYQYEQHHDQGYGQGHQAHEQDQEHQRPHHPHRYSHFLSKLTGALTDAVRKGADGLGNGIDSVVGAGRSVLRAADTIVDGSGKMLSSIPKVVSRTLS